MLGASIVFVQRFNCSTGSTALRLEMEDSASFGQTSTGVDSAVNDFYRINYRAKLILLFLPGIELVELLFNVKAMESLGPRTEVNIFIYILHQFITLV